MEWQVLALVLAAPVILLPVGFMWYLNVGGVNSAIREDERGRPLPGSDLSRRQASNPNSPEEARHLGRRQR